MSGMQRADKLFWAVQLAAFVLVKFVPNPTWALHGIHAAQAALLGIWLAVGPLRPTTRVAGAALIVCFFGFVASMLAIDINFGGLIGIEIGWELLLILVRTCVVGGFYWYAFLRRGYELSDTATPLTDSLLRFRMHHVLVLMTLVALYFAAHRSLEGGPFYQLMLVVFITFFGTLCAAVPLLTSLAVFEPTHSKLRYAAYLAGILGATVLIAAQTYDSMTNWLMVGRQLLQILVEVCWLALSLIMLRRRGLRLAKLPTDDAEKSAGTTNQSLARAEYMRLAVKAAAVVAVILVIWIGWSIRRVEKRQQLRASIDGRPTPTGIMAFITAADGSAAASKATKDRIAPLVSEISQIRNSGGTVFGPTKRADLSFVRHWLGDEPVSWILVDDQQDIDQFQSAFPEATIAVRPPPKPTVNPPQPPGGP